MDQAVYGDARYSDALDGPAESRGGQRVPRQGDGLSAGYGGSRTLRQALPPVWGGGSAHPLRRQGDELLRPMPDAWKSARGSRSLPSARSGLAPDFGGIGGGH